VNLWLGVAMGTLRWRFPLCCLLLKRWGSTHRPCVMVSMGSFHHHNI
jgi:hypothetical protein